MVVKNAVYARIDRPAGFVVFRKRAEASDILNGWSRNMAKLLDLVEKSSQQIQKDATTHKITIGAS
jgi:26S proteasome regulatory subunit N5